MSEADDQRGQARTTAERRELFGALRLVGVVGLTIAAAVTGGVLLGLVLSRRLGGAAWPLAVGTILGVAFSFVWVYRTLSKFGQRLPPSPTTENENEDA